MSRQRALDFPLLGAVNPERARGWLKFPTGVPKWRFAAGMTLVRHDPCPGSAPPVFKERLLPVILLPPGDGAESRLLSPPNLLRSRDRRTASTRSPGGVAGAQRAPMRSVPRSRPRGARIAGRGGAVDGFILGKGPQSARTRPRGARTDPQGDRMRPRIFCSRPLLGALHPLWGRYRPLGDGTVPREGATSPKEGATRPKEGRYVPPRGREHPSRGWNRTLRGRDGKIRGCFAPKRGRAAPF